MSVFGIICELNPIHRGHQYLIEQAKANGAEAVVCVMSGATTQRGEFAIADPYIRAKAAILAGADLILELPFPWCSASAEGFARGGIGVLRHFSDTVLFGSECGNLSVLRQAAETADTAEFMASFQTALQNGEGAAKAYCDCLKNFGCPPLSSNDLLGVAYLRAAKELNADLSFQTVQRQGAAYRQINLPSNEFPSAMAIRRLWKNQRFDETIHAIPTECVDLFQQAIMEGKITSEKELDSVWLSFFRLHDATDFDDLVGCEGGLAQRICSAACRARSYEELLQMAKTKRYTDAHLRRTMLYCLAKVKIDDIRSLPQYTTLLAANEIGRELLSRQRKQCPFPVVTKPADAPKDLMQSITTEKIQAIFALATKEKHSASCLLTQSPYVR